MDSRMAGLAIAMKIVGRSPGHCGGMTATWPRFEKHVHCMVETPADGTENAMDGTNSDPGPLSSPSSVAPFVPTKLFPNETIRAR